MLSHTYDEIVISERTCREWFQRFKNGDFDIEDWHSTGREKVFKDAELEALLHEDSCQTQEEFAGSLGVTQQAISKRLKAMAMIQKQIGCRTTRSRETLNGVCLLNSYSKGKDGRDFCIAL